MGWSDIFCVFSLQGTSAEQDNRFSNKQKKLLKQLKFAECLEKKVRSYSFRQLFMGCAYCIRLPDCYQCVRTCFCSCRKLDFMSSNLMK